MTVQSVGQRIESVLDHLGVEQTHVGACMSADWGDLVGPLRSRVSTLAVVAPHLNKGIPSDTRTFERPTIVLSGDQGAPAENARALAEMFPAAKFVGLPGYSSPAWANTVADRLNEVKSAMLGVISESTESGAPAPMKRDVAEGHHAGLTYRIQGSGPPLLLLPLSLSASQWTPLIEELTDDFCIISLGGAHLGAVALLEGRARSGYGELVASMLDAANLGPGEIALEVGCGSGALSRGLLACSETSSRIVATDLNPYLLSEAKALADAEGIVNRIRFEEADGTQLQYGDSEFDMAFSSTVLEEAPADQMLSEPVRTTKPGGRIVAITRATDVDWWVNLDLPKDLRRTLNANGPKAGAGVGADGCADASLYERAQDAGIKPHRSGPQFAAYRDGERLEDVLARLGSTLAENDRDAFNGAVEQGRSSGTLMVCEPFHCFVGEVH